MDSDNSLSVTDSFSELMLSDLTKTISDIAEAGLDTILDDGFLKEVPVLSSAIAVFKFGSKIKFAHEIKKLAIFITELNNNKIDKEKIRKYKEKKTKEDNHFKRELEHLLIILEKYLEHEKPKLLAKLYIAYINGIFEWNTFCAYSVVIEKLIIYDFAVLMQFKDKEGLRKAEINDIAAILRLSSLGLIEIPSGQRVFSIGDRIGVAHEVYEYDYKITNFGAQFISNL